MQSLISSGHPVVSQTAAEILKKGGNAYDAIIAAGFSSCLAEPTLTSLGGGGFLLAKPKNKTEQVFDFFVNMPGLGLNQKQNLHFLEIEVVFSDSTQIFHAGLGSAAVPGNLKAFLEIHNELGILPITDIVAPAIAQARAGVPVSQFQRHVMDLLEPILLSSPESKKLFAPQGELLKIGELYKNPDFADFLENIIENSQSFYEGKIAQNIAQEMQKNDGLITQEDLAKFTINKQKPVKSKFREYNFVSCPKPSVGGELIAQFLQEYNRGSHDFEFASEEHLLKLIDNMAKIENIRNTASKGTTHISVADADGNIASMTTSNGEGSGYIVKGTGIMLNNMLGEDDLFPNGPDSFAAGQRINSMMSPSLLEDKNEQPLIVLGSGGSKRIRSAIAQVIINLIDFKMSLAEAIKAPRLHYDDDLVQLEPNLIDPKTSQLGQYKLNHWKQKNLYFGGVHAIKLPEQAVADDRRDGAAIVDFLPVEP